MEPNRYVDQKLPTNSVKVSNVTDPLAIATNPSDPNYVPNSKQELEIAFKLLIKDIDASKVPYIYNDIKRLLQNGINSEDDSPNQSNNSSSCVSGVANTKEEGKMNSFEKVKMLREWAKQTLSEITPNTSLSFSGYEYGSEDEDDEDVVKPIRKNSTVTDEGATFEELAKELGMSVSGAKKAVDMALEKARFIAVGMENNELEIVILNALAEYIDILASSGELDESDIALLKNNPTIVRELDGFREFLDGVIKKARRNS